MKDLLVRIAERLMRCPAAPYHEELVAAEVLRICSEFNLPCEIDPFGNFLIRSTARPPKRTVKNPIVLAAHMDHPGFIVRRKLSPTSFTADFLGGVGDSYFKPGVKLRLMPGHVPATLGKRLSPKKRSFGIRSARPITSKPLFAVWDLPEFEFASGQILGRVCDDLIGCATILAVLVSLRGTSAAANVIGVLSRAEEVGFHGALALAESKRLPRQSLIISLETSRELPPVKIGNGVILRVGDRASIFDSASTRFLSELAADLTKRDKSFKSQRALMSGGTCEATAYQEYGYRSAAVCVALGNYHNCGDQDTIGAEFISASDATSMAQLLVAAARVWPESQKLIARLPQRLARLSKDAHRNLRKRPLPLAS
jgi:endoglucanase